MFPYYNRQNCSNRWNLVVPNYKDMWLATSELMQYPRDFVIRRAVEAADDMHHSCWCLFFYLLCMKLVRFSFCCYLYYYCLTLDCCGCLYSLDNIDRYKFAIALAPRQRNTYRKQFYNLFDVSHMNFRFLEIKTAIVPWIIESLWITARIISLTTIIPCTNFIAINFTRIETSYKIFIARWSSSACFSRHSKVAPSILAFLISRGNFD